MKISVDVTKFVGRKHLREKLGNLEKKIGLWLTCECIIEYSRRKKGQREEYR